MIIHPNGLYSFMAAANCCLMMMVHKIHCRRPSLQLGSSSAKPEKASDPLHGDLRRQQFMVEERQAKMIVIIDSEKGFEAIDLDQIQHRRGKFGLLAVKTLKKQLKVKHRKCFDISLLFDYSLISTRVSWAL